MAPAIRPKPSKAPKPVVRGINIKMDATSSRLPMPILPQGSIPKIVNRCTDCGAAENLKYNVCNIINAARTLNNQVKILSAIVLVCW